MTTRRISSRSNRFRVLHFADAHIDMANFGRHDPVTGLPMRVMDFLKSLDAIIDAATREQIDLVIFAGDAFKDRTPAPTFQREWGKRVMRLSRAGIPTLLLVGNHDIAPALGRAHTLESFDTLEVPHVRVIDRPVFLKPEDLESLPVQVLCLPWVSRSGLMASLEMSAAEPSQVYEVLEQRLTDLIHGWLDDANPELPVILTAHCSIQGASYGGERTVMLGADLVLPPSLVKDPRLDYVALGHIHKPQDLNEGKHPPVIYPGSIERVDIGEAQDEKYFVIADISRGRTEVEWRKLSGIRPMIDRHVTLKSEQNVMERLLSALPKPKALEGAIVRLVVEYPRHFEPLIDDLSLHQAAASAFEFHLAKHPQVDVRVRLPEGPAIGSLTPLELLDLYWGANNTASSEQEALRELAAQIVADKSA